MTPDELLAYLLRHAEASGIKEGALAQQAGLTPQGLSKAKTRGDLRVSTLEALGRQINLELTWRPLQPQPEASEKVRAGTLFQFGAKPRGKT